MPYAIEPKDGKYEVVNKETGDVKGTHATRAKAEAQMRALYANEPEAKSGARNSRRDKMTIESIREQARAIAALLDELEPEPTEDEASEIDENTPAEMNASYAKSISSFWDIETLAVKKVGADLIRHPVFIWGNSKQTDLEGEFFTRDSDFWDRAQGKTRPLTWDHAQDESFKADPLIGMTVEWEDDEVARWAISQLDKTHKYRKAIERLIDTKSLGSAPIAVPLLGASSDSAPQYVERQTVGKGVWLKRWPWFATALTTAPCEPRMIEAGKGVAYLKSLGISLPDAPDLARQFEVLQLRAKVLHIKGV